MTTKTAGSGIVRVWAYERKVVLSLYCSGGNMDSIQAAERDVHALLAKVTDALFRMGAASSKSPYKPTRAIFSAEDGYILVTAQIGCDIVSSGAAIPSKLGEALPAHFSVVVR